MIFFLLKKPYFFALLLKIDAIDLCHNPNFPLDRLYYDYLIALQTNHKRKCIDNHSNIVNKKMLCLQNIVSYII